MTIASHRAPGSFRVVRVWELSRLEDLATVRAALRVLLCGTEPGDTGIDQLPDRIVLAASELAANAMRHGAPPAELRLLTDGEAWVLDAVDHDAARGPRLARRRRPGDGGYGLVLVRRLSDGVGSYVTGDAKHVWARFAADVEEPRRRTA